ncbi:hypothetical protein T01_12517 [Trichinella spiralis]|uniref:Uncharacterized protein n=1 Tax=Trichinella spiralis TaxID=6334 RepID=A0A0V0Z4T1_TRISP|nr:hypothetical protein T01_12517 [Trichinella spiralis]
MVKKYSKYDNYATLTFANYSVYGKKEEEEVLSQRFCSSPYVSKDDRKMNKS